MSRARLQALAEKAGHLNGELILVGMGLWDHKGISLAGLLSAKRADEVYAEFYTSIMPDMSTAYLEKEIGKKITILGRHDLEEKMDQSIMNKARDRRIVLLVPGDPFAATTHVSLRLRACELGIRTTIIHSASIFSAAPSLTGLQHYKFGRTVTIPFPQEGHLPMSPYDVIADNLARGLHTLVLLDLDAERGKYLSVNEALTIMLEIENTKGKKVFSDDRLVIGVARVGSSSPVVRCDFIKGVMKFDFGAPPHTLIVPGELHFMEAESLVKLFGAPRTIVQGKG